MPGVFGLSNFPDIPSHVESVVGALHAPKLSDTLVWRLEWCFAYVATHIVIWRWCLVHSAMQQSTCKANASYGLLWSMCARGC